MNGLIQSDLVISILVVALLTAVGRLILGIFSVGVEGAAVFVAAGYVVVYLSTLLWARLRTPAIRRGAPGRLVPQAPTVEETGAGEESGAGAAQA